MDRYPTYLIHYGIPGQKWGQRNYQNPDGTWTEEGKERRRYTKEGYKQLKKDYKRHVKEADKEFIKITKDSGKNKIHPYKKAQYDSIDKVDEFATKIASELFEEFKKMKAYEANLKGKDFDESKLKMQRYFEHITIENDDFLNVSAPSITAYTVRQGKNGPKVRKSMHFA